MMHNLRLLQFYKSKPFQESKVYIPTFLESLPEDLKFLRWDSFPQRSLPLDFCPENLVELDMRNSNLEQLWEGDQHLPNLKRLDLSGSMKLSHVPDLSQCPNIEEIILSHCVQLVRVYSSRFLSKLNCLWLNACLDLVILNLPSNILSSSSGLIILNNCRNLETFSVSNMTKGVVSYGCSRGRLFPQLVVPCNANSLTRGTRVLDPYCDLMDFADIYEEQPEDNIHLRNLQLSREGSASLFPSLNKLCWLNLSHCESLTSLPIDLCKLKFLKKLYLRGCSYLEEFPEIKETMENLTVLILDETAIQNLPASLYRLVGLEELSLRGCQRLELIPPSIGSLSKLCKLDLTCCESLETLPSSIFKLKLTKLDLHGCSMLTTFPEIMEPAESFAHLRLTKTAIKELPSSLKYLVGLQTLRLNLCKDLEFLPKSIGNLKLLSELDVSGCEKLLEIPKDIGCLSLLKELSLHGSGIVNLPDSIAHLSSLKSLDLSDCKRLECIPELPPFSKQLLAFDCPSIRRVSSSRIKLPSNSKECIFKFHLTNSQELNPSAASNIVADACYRMLQDAYRSVFFCFPGRVVPQWFPYWSKGHSVTLDGCSLNLCNRKRFVGFALCVVFGFEDKDDKGVLKHEDTRGTVPLALKVIPSDFSYSLKYESDDGMGFLPGDDDRRSYFNSKDRCSDILHDHTFLWKYYLESTSMSHVLSRAHSFTFEIFKREGKFERIRSMHKLIWTIKAKECGICPLYIEEKDDKVVTGGDCSNLQRFSNATT